MPFDFDDYQKRCNGMTKEQLHAEWDNYTREISAGATSTATSVLLSPLTAGISLVGLGISAPRIHNARKKREIIDAGLHARGTVHHTHVRDVVAPMAISGAISGLSLGIAGPAVNVAGAAAVQHGVGVVATNAALAATAHVAAKTYGINSKEKDPKQQEVLQQQVTQNQIWMSNSSPALEDCKPGPLNARPGLYTSQTWPQNSAQYDEDLEKVGYMATPSVSDDFGLSTPTSSLADIYDQITFQLQQPFTETQPDPQLGIQSSHTWPQNSAGSPKTSAEIQALGADRAKLARAQNKLDRKAAQKRQSFTSLSSAQSSPDPQYLSASPATCQESSPQKLSRSLSVRSIMVENGDGSPPSALTAEEEILFLRGGLLQLEIQKRGEEVQVYGADQIQAQQITHIQFLVEDELQTPGSLSTKPYLATTPQHLTQQRQDQNSAPHPLRRHSPSAPILPTNLLDVQSPSTNQETGNHEHPAQPAAANSKRNSIPRKKVGSGGRVSSSPHEMSHSGPISQALPAVAEDHSPAVTCAEQQNYPPSFYIQEKPLPKERQDSGYYSLSSKSPPLSPDQADFDPQQTPEFLSFTPQAFGLPPSVSSQIIEHPQLERQSSLPSMSGAAAQDKPELQFPITSEPPCKSPTEHDSQIPFPRKSSIQSEDESLFSVSRKTSQATSQKQSNSRMSVASVPEVVEHRDLQSSIYTASPPPPYCSPPPETPSIPIEKTDYFGREIDAAPTPLKTLKARARKSMLDIQGWQWGK